MRNSTETQPEGATCKAAPPGLFIIIVKVTKTSTICGKAPTDSKKRDIMYMVQKEIVDYELLPSGKSTGLDLYRQQLAALKPGHWASIIYRNLWIERALSSTMTITDHIHASVSGRNWENIYGQFKCIRRIAWILRYRLFQSHSFIGFNRVSMERCESHIFDSETMEVRQWWDCDVTKNKDRKSSIHI